MALAASPIDAQHPSCPAYKVIDAASVASGGSLTSDVVDVAAYEEATIFVQASTGPTTIYALLSLDGVTFFNTVQHVDTAGPRYLAVLVTNGAAGASTVSAWAAVQGMP